MMKKSMIVFATAICMSLTQPALADPTIFGLEMGKTTEKEFLEAYKAVKTGVNKWNNGNMYNINRGEIDFRGIEKAFVIFHPDKTLHLFQAELPKNSFNYLKEILDGKYAVEESRLAFVGNQYMRYRDGSTTIELKAPHLSFEMTLIYMRDEFRQQFEEKSAEEREQEEEQDKSKF